MSLPRIYADFNGIVFSPRREDRKGVALDTFGTLRDLANAGIVLREDLPLTIHDASDEAEDLEADCLACYDDEAGYWVAEFDEHGYRYVPARDRSTTSVFLCVECRRELGDWIRANGMHLGDRCPACGMYIHRPIAPPPGTMLEWGDAGIPPGDLDGPSAGRLGPWRR